MIATIRFDAAAIGIDGVEFRRLICSERVSGLEQNPAVVKDIGGQCVGWNVSESERLAACDIGSLDHEPARNLARVNEAVTGKIQRSDTVPRTRRYAAR